MGLRVSGDTKKSTKKKVCVEDAYTGPCFVLGNRPQVLHRVTGYDPKPKTVTTDTFTTKTKRRA